MTPIEDASGRNPPQGLARLGGALYLIIIVLGLFGEAGVRGRLIVTGDPASTAERIRSAELLWRAGIAGEYLLLVCAVALTLIFYVLLRPVSRDVALLATIFNLVSIAIEAVGGQHLVAALFPLGDADYLKVLAPAERDTLAYLSIRAHVQAFGASLLFFGCVCLLLGYLIFRSGYLPKAIGVLMQIAGVCYLANSLAMILAPALASRLFPAILLPAFVGEASFCVWLLVKGVDAAGWAARAR